MRSTKRYAEVLADLRHDTDDETIRRKYGFDRTTIKYLRETINDRGRIVNDGYAYRCRWSQEDGEFVGYVDKSPSLSWLDPTRDKALAGIRDVTSDVLTDMRAGRSFGPKEET